MRAWAHRSATGSGGEPAHPFSTEPDEPAYARDGTAEHYLARYGYGKAILLARFLPVVRTVLNPLAGAVGVPQRTFTLWQIIGGLVWSLGVIIAGYLLGSHISNVDHNLLPIIAVIIVVSLIPIGAEIRRTRAARSEV